MYGEKRVNTLHSVYDARFDLTIIPVPEIKTKILQIYVQIVARRLAIGFRKSVKYNKLNVIY